MFDVEQIRSVIPHRYPFLLVDKILEINEDETVCIGLKNVTINEKVLNGHIPGMSTFPNPMLIEHMAQVGCYILMKKPYSEGKIAYFAGIDEVEFIKPIVPGDTIITKVELLTGRRGIWKLRAESKVDGMIVCCGNLTCALVDK